MYTEVEDLRRRVEILEGQVASMEHRLDTTELHLEIVTDWRRAERVASEPAGVDDQEAESDTPDPRFGRIESMLRSVLLRQADHAAALRMVDHSVQRLVERKVS
jgi:hypothetical protein